MSKRSRPVIPFSQCLHLSSESAILQSHSIAAAAALLHPLVLSLVLLRKNSIHSTFELSKILHFLDSVSITNELRWQRNGFTRNGWRILQHTLKSVVTSFNASYLVIDVQLWKAPHAIAVQHHICPSGRFNGKVYLKSKLRAWPTMAMIHARKQSSGVAYLLVWYLFGSQ